MTSRPYAEVIGDPIAHSRSPIIHRFWLDQLGIAADYLASLVPKSRYADHVDRRRADRCWRGANVTMPLKLEALAHADDKSDTALAAGAANLIYPREGRLIAENTDVGAIALLLGKLKDGGAAMGNVTLFGNGGAARAALVACRMLGIDQVTIQARDLAAALSLSVQFGLPNPPRPLTDPVESDGIINATPLGMSGVDCLNCDLSALPAKGWVFDFVTDRSPLVDAATVRGLATVRGIEMLVEQASASFAILFGTAAPRDQDEQLMLRLAP